MSILDIRQALENAVNSISNPIAIAWENVPFTPVSGVPYMQVYLMRGQPENPEMGHGFREVGVLQCNLFYPITTTGTALAETKAEQIRAKFPRGASFTKNDTIVTIRYTAEIGRGDRIDGYYMIPIKVFWHSNNFN